MTADDDRPRVLSDLRTFAQESSDEGRPASPDLRETILAVWTAVDATRMHASRVSPSDGGTGRYEYARAPDLVELWNEAAVALARHDPELSHRLRLKAEFWSEPRSWTLDEVEHAGIRMEEIAESTRGLRQLFVPSPTPDPGGARTPDVFLSYASEDRVAVADPLAEAMTASGVDVWYDRMALSLGDRIREEIDEGLAASRLGAVVFSPSFLGKNFPRNEEDRQ